MRALKLAIWFSHDLVLDLPSFRPLSPGLSTRQSIPQRSRAFRTEKSNSRVFCETILLPADGIDSSDQLLINFPTPRVKLVGKLTQLDVRVRKVFVCSSTFYFAFI